MNNRQSLAARLAAITLAAVSLSAVTGCAVTRGQSSVGAYVDDTAITVAVKAKLTEAETVDAAAISVETLNGTVQLSGFAKNATEKTDAESLARTVKGVKAVDNRITVRG